VGQRRAQDTLESLRVAHDVVTAETNAITLSTARWLQVSGHPTDDAGWMVIGQRLRVRIDAETGDGALVDRGDPECVVTLEMIPRRSPSARRGALPWPRVVGLQTARVTRPSGQEIYCDAAGAGEAAVSLGSRGQARRAHHLLGAGVAGAHHRVGGHSLASAGRCWWSFSTATPTARCASDRSTTRSFPPSYSLPAEKAVTGHKSYSLPGRGATNEVMLDDSAGAQRVAINGGHDINVVVAHDRILNVGANATRTVVGKRSAAVSGNESMSVEGSDSGKVAGDESISVGANRTVGVDQSATEEIVGAMSLSVGAMENVKVGSPGAAVLEIIQREAVAAAKGVKASAAASQGAGGPAGADAPGAGPGARGDGAGDAPGRSGGGAGAVAGRGARGGWAPRGGRRRHACRARRPPSDAAGTSAAIANGSMPPGGGGGGGEGARTRARATPRAARGRASGARWWAAT
jgi:type VI secretion system secreted protein VgrG